MVRLYFIGHLTLTYKGKAMFRPKEKDASISLYSNIV